MAAPPVDMAPPFDLAQIQPPPRSGLGPDDLLEITIWDLYEPGKPHTFPARLDGQGQINVPHLDPIAVKDSSPTEIESRLVDAYRQHDLLKQPRVLVRELGSAPLHVYVTGAVLRPGLINLPKRDASVFSVLIAAGGLSRNAGLHVFVSDHTAHNNPGKAAATPQNAGSQSPVVAGNAPLQLPAEQTPAAVPPVHLADAHNTDAEQAPAQHLSNHSSPLAVSPDGQTQDSKRGLNSVNAPTGVVEAVATRPDFPTGRSDNENGKWYDLSVDRDREQLKQLVLQDGDVVTVRPVAAPIRITGAVAQPGSYRAPARNALTLLDAIQLAGGFGASDRTMSVVLTRPATAETSLQRWTVHVGHGLRLPANIPYIQPGDLIHVEPTAQARVQSLVDAVWPGK